ncbi:MAATS1-like protein [Chloropicon primus]|uniref:Cilia- and flagella-associated protein 91 n=1 Tax=Chloropicon primus TaxID=1764295 RepID=A0A5B8N0N0_9CHLO|nr:MAATS1-like protein [Chloropicon primus]UPR04661.1 MAATS1-like protein [Chloropicon primus]|eukprot:QDZ25465.1 MAATS1-like protein [Chloropicon primus]
MTSQPTRAYDSLYDKDYTVSGSRDFYRDQARAGGFTLERVPQYGNLFSEIPTYPSQTVRFRNVDKVPPTVNREFQGNASATLAEVTHKSNADRVSGNNRYMFFRRPLYAPSNQMLDQPPPNVVLEPQDPIPDNEVKPVGLPKLSRTFGTQSDYREMETQTQPYEPDYVLPKDMSLKQQKLDDKFHLNGMPEVLTLKDFKYGTDEKLQLPVGLYEVQKIEKMREKRAFEASLPPLSDQSKIHVRKRMLDEWESKEWAYRENEIKIVQDERLDKMEQQLLKRERRLEAETKKRLEKLERQKIADNQSLLADIQKRRIKTMRKLEKKRQFSAFKPEKPTRAEEYANYGSKVYAPLTREGKAADAVMDETTIDPVPYQPREITNFVSMQNTLNFESLAPEEYRALQNEKANDIPGHKDRDLGQKAAKVVTKQLEHVMDLLEKSKEDNGRRGIGSCWPQPLAATNQQKASAPSALEQVKKKKKVQLEKEEVVMVEIPDPNQVASENAIILLQRLLRGRATQNEMYSGKERRLDLIEELQTKKEQDLPAIVSVPEEVEKDAILGVHFAELLDILAIHDAKQQTVLLYEGQDKWAEMDRVNGLYDTPPSTSGSTSRATTANASSRATSRGTMGMMSRGSAGFGPLNPDLAEESPDQMMGEEPLEGQTDENSQYIDSLVDGLIEELSSDNIDDLVDNLVEEVSQESIEEAQKSPVKLAVNVGPEEEGSLKLTLSFS